MAKKMCPFQHVCLAKLVVSFGWNTLITFLIVGLKWYEHFSDAKIRKAWYI